MNEYLRGCLRGGQSGMEAVEKQGRGPVMASERLFGRALGR